jgi:hypothetical protein
MLFFAINAHGKTLDDQDSRSPPRGGEAPEDRVSLLIFLSPLGERSGEGVATARAVDRPLAGARSMKK